MVAPFVKSLAEQIDTTGSGGKLIFHVFGALTEFEQDLIRREQMLAIRQLDEKKLQMLQPLYADKSNSVADILATLNISKSTLYRYVKQDKRL